jgi:hypothetical protein
MKTFSNQELAKESCRAFVWLASSVADTVYCGSLPVVQGVFRCPLFIGYGIAGNRVISRIPHTSRPCRIAPSSFGLEYPWPHAFWDHRLPSPSAGEPGDHREGEGSAGETSLVQQTNGRRGLLIEWKRRQNP